MILSTNTKREPFIDIRATCNGNVINIGNTACIKLHTIESIDKIVSKRNSLVCCSASPVVLASFMALMNNIASTIINISISLIVIGLIIEMFKFLRTGNAEEFSKSVIRLGSGGVVIWAVPHIVRFIDIIISGFIG